MISPTSPAPSSPVTVVYACGSGGTGAGLILGAKLLGLAERGIRIAGVNVCDDRAYFVKVISAICAESEARWQLGTNVTPDDIDIVDGHVGLGYAKSRPEELATIRDLCRSDGVVLDPVYTGKAFHGVLTELHADPRRFGASGRVHPHRRHLRPVRMIRTTTVLVLVASLATAHAEKSVRTAQVLSGVGTGVSSGLFLAAFLTGDKEGSVNHPVLYTAIGTSVITPSLGEYYAGQYVTVGSVVRVLAGGLAIYAVTAQTETVRCATIEFSECKELTGTATVLLGIAALAFVGGAAYDVMDADDAVKRYNARTRMALVPAVTPESAGLVVTGQF